MGNISFISLLTQLMFLVSALSHNIAFAEDGVKQSSVSNQCDQVIEIEQGKVLGKHISDRGYDFCSYKGIQYAQAPVGDLRWRPPQKVEKHDGVFKAFNFGDQCPQNLTSSEAQSGLGTLQASEDCLNLNIWKPATESDEPLPVMVWIHGGALILGANSWNLYRGGIFAAKQNVIIVSINYRLGYFGYLSHPALIDENDGYQGGSAGNYGLLDQIHALKWVNQNIEAFGGDKDNVTVFGESAGGWSVSYLLASDFARPYFHKAIMQSGGSEVVIENEKAFELGESITERIGCNTDSDIGQCLRMTPVSSFVDDRPGFDWVLRVPKMIWKNLIMEKEPGYSLAPRVDGVILEAAPLDIFKSNDYLPPPFMAGFTSGDPKYLAEGTEKTAQAFSEKRDVYFYNFDYRDHRLGLFIGGSHGTELPVLFDSAHVFDVVWSLFNLYSNEQLAKVQPLSDQMQAYWANFARTGKPGTRNHLGEKIHDWPAYGESQTAILFDYPVKTVSLKE